MEENPRELIRFTDDIPLPGNFFPLQVELSPSGIALEFRALNVVVGRSTEADFRLPSSCISRKHCKLTWKSEGWVLEDLESENGTWVNGEKILTRALDPKDEIRIGDFHFQVLNSRPQVGLQTLLRNYRKAG